MNKLSPTAHGILDYSTVLLLFIAPATFQFQHMGSLFTYALATVHLLLTLLTDFRAGIIKIIPMRIHGLIELVVSFVLVGVAIYFRNYGDTKASNFYLIFSILLFVVWFISDYKGALKKSANKSPVV